MMAWSRASDCRAPTATLPPPRRIKTVADLAPVKRNSFHRPRWRSEKAVSRWIEAQAGWPIRKFVKTARSYCTIEIQAGRQTTSLSQLGLELGMSWEEITALKEDGSIT
jgi:hypothetical protein